MEFARDSGIHGSCDKMIALLLFDPMAGRHARQALLRWTGVCPAYSADAKLKGPPRNIRYSHNAEVDARIAFDVALLPRRPLPTPGPGPRSMKHGAHTDKAIRNARLSRLGAQPPHGVATIPGRTN